VTWKGPTLCAWSLVKLPGGKRSGRKRTRTTTRKLLNTNGNTEGIFSSVNFRGILPTELPWEKNLKQSKKKKMTCHFYQRNYRWKYRRNFPSVFLSVNCEHCSSCQLQRESPTEFSRECYLAVFWKNSINLKLSFKYYRRNHRRNEKPSVIVGGFWKKFTKLKI